MASRSIAKLAIQLSVNSMGVRSGLSRGKQEVQSFGASVKSMAAKAVAALASLQTAMEAVRFVKWGVELAAQTEQAQIAFEVLFESAGTARTMIEDLKAFAASTPFQFPQLRDASRQLAALGFEAKEILPTLKMLGDVSAAMGVPIGELAYLYATTRSEGRLFARDLRQFTTRGVINLEDFARQLGTTTEGLNEMVSAGEVGFADVEQYFQQMTSEGGKFFNMSQRQAESTAGRFSTLKDNVGFLAEEIGTTLLPALNDLTEAGIGSARALNDALGRENTKQMSYGLFGVAGMVLGIRNSLEDVPADGGYFDHMLGWMDQFAQGMEETQTRIDKLTLEHWRWEIEQWTEKIQQAEKEAAVLVEQTATPLERLQKQLERLNELQDLGVLGTETMARAAEMYREQFSEALNDQKKIEQSTRSLSGVGFAQRGTTEAFSAIQSAVRYDREQRVIERQQLQAEQAQVGILEQIRNNTANGLTVEEVTF